MGNILVYDTSCCTEGSGFTFFQSCSKSKPTAYFGSIVFLLCFPFTVEPFSKDLALQESKHVNVVTKVVPLIKMAENITSVLLRSHVEINLFYYVTMLAKGN